MGSIDGGVGLGGTVLLSQSLKSQCVIAFFLFFSPAPIHLIQLEMNNAKTIMGIAGLTLELVHISVQQML